MKAIHAAFLAMLAITILASALAYDHIDAETLPTGDVVISGDVYLDGDVRIESGSDVIIMDGASIDISDHTVTIGQGSKALVLGSASVSSSGGSIILESGVPLSILDIPLFRMEGDITVTFDGTISLSLDPLLGTLRLGFQPSGSDKSIHLSQGSRTLALEKPGLTAKMGIGNVDITVGFSKIVLTEEKRDGNSLVSRTATTITSSNPEDSLEFVLYLIDEGYGDFYLKDINIRSVEMSTYHAESRITTSWSLSGFHHLSVSLSGSGIISVSSAIDKATFERSRDGIVESRTVLNSINWDVDLDLIRLFQMLEAVIFGGDKIEVSDMIKDVTVAIKSISIDDREKDIRKNLTGFRFELQRDAPAEFRNVIVWKDGDTSYRLAFSGVILNSIGIGTDFMMDLDVSVADARLDVVPSQGPKTAATATDLDFEINDLDLPGLLSVLSRTGEIDIQQILDHCLRLRLSASSMAYSKDGQTIAARGISMSLEKDVRGRSTFALGFSSIKGSAILEDGGYLSMDIGKTAASLTTDGSLAEYIDALRSVPHISGDSDLAIQIKTESVRIDFEDAGGSASVSSRPVTANPSAISLDLSVRHTAYKDITGLSGSFLAVGHEITAKEHDAEKGLDLVAIITDPDLTLNGADLGSLAAIREETGKISVLDIADNIDSAELLARYADVRADGSRIKLASPEIRAGAIRSYSVGISADSMSADASAAGLSIKSGSASLSFSSSISFSTLQKAFSDGFRFDSDVSISFEGTVTDAEAKYAGDSLTAVISNSGSPTLEIDLSYERSERWGISALTAELYANGYGIEADGSDKNGERFAVSLQDPEAAVKDLDVDALSAAKEAGEIDVFDVLDNTGRADIDASSASMNYRGYEITVRSFGIDTISSNVCSASLAASSLSALAPAKTGNVSIKSGALDLRVSSNMSFAGIRDALLEGKEFEPGAKIAAEASFESLNLSYSADFAISISGTSEKPTLTLDATAARLTDSSETLSDMEIVATGYRIIVDSAGSDGTAMNARIDDPSASVKGLDIDAVRSEFEESGKLTLDMLDHCESARIQAASLSVDAKGERTFQADAAAPSLIVGTGAESSARFESGTLEISASLDEGKLSMNSSAMEAAASSNLSFADIMAIIGGDLKPGSDSEAAVSLSMTDLSADYADEKIKISLGRSASASATMTLDATVRGEDDSGDIFLWADLSAKGYAMRFDSSGVSYGKVPVKGDKLHIESRDINLSASELNLSELRRIYDETDKIKIQQIIDSCSSLSLSAEHAELEWDGDGKSDAIMEKSEANASKDGNGISTVTMGVEKAAASIPLEGRMADIQSNRTEISLSSSIPISELVELIIDGLDFKKDTSVRISAETDGIRIAAEMEKGDVSLELSPKENPGDAIAKAEIALDHSESSGSTTIDGKIDALGYRTTINMVLSQKFSGKLSDLPFPVGEGSAIAMGFDDLSVDLAGFDAATAYELLSEYGSLTAQQILDCCDRMGIGASDASIDINGDGEIELATRNSQATLSKNKGQNMISFNFDWLKTSMEMSEAEIRAQLGASEILLFTEGSISECIDALFSGVNFSSDTRAELHISNEAAVIECLKEEDCLTMTNANLRENSPKYVTVVMSLEYSSYRDQTTLVGKISSIGHSVTLKDRSAVNDEGGILDLSFRTDEVSGGFEMVYGDGIGFSANLCMPWKAEFGYYDVQFQMESGESVVSLTRGNLAVDGYDHRKQGLLAVVPAIKSSSFAFENRVLMSSDSMRVLRSGTGEVISSYGDAELDVEKVKADLRRGDTLNVILERLDIRITDQDGKVTERSLERLDVTTDQSGAEPEKSWVEKNSLLLAAVFIAASIAMIAALIIIRMKNREPPETEG